jgi:hypothetical protein
MPITQAGKQFTGADIKNTAGTLRVSPAIPHRTASTSRRN